MKNFILILFSSLIIFSIAIPTEAVWAGATYTIDDKFQAYFPSKPSYVGSAGEGKFLTKSYKAYDEENAIGYFGTINYGPFKFAPSDISEALKNHAIGDASIKGGNLSSYEPMEVAGNYGYLSIISFTVDGTLTVKKYNVTLLYKGQFFSWSIQGIKGYSDKKAEEFFVNYIEYFSPK